MIVLAVLTAAAHADPDRCIAPATASGDFHPKPQVTIAVGCDPLYGDCSHFNDNDAPAPPPPREPDRQWFELAGHRVLVHHRVNDRVATLEVDFNIVRCTDESSPVFVAHTATLRDFDGSTRVLGQTSVQLTGDGRISIFDEAASHEAAGHAMGCGFGCPTENVTTTGERAYANGKPLDPAAAARAEADRKKREAIAAAQAAREQAEWERQRAAHRQQLKASFQPPPQKKPVTPEVRKQKTACLGGDAVACMAAQPKPIDPTVECHMRREVERFTCYHEKHTCQSQCENANYECTMQACNAACARNPNSLQCTLLCTCPHPIECNCPTCSAADAMCNDGPASQTKAQ
ncbi:MAG TPA: hypothetical protein VLT45_09925 [Kofleriaceae bacterium]|nr:hypothetical protein [Kofleriaceae bacterium]